MARKATGQASLDHAKEVIATTRSADEMRAALAVALPLLLDLSLEDTARVLGQSVSGTCKMRTRFIKEQSGETPKTSAKRSLRNRAHASFEREAEVLEAVLAKATSEDSASVQALKPKVEALLGKTISLATLYNMLSRHGWSKVSPRQAKTKTDTKTQSLWKKTTNEPV